MDGNTFIGFYDAYSKAYCKKCGNLFVYHWNGCEPMCEDKTCPNCGEFDEVETENHINTRIDILKMFRGFPESNDDEVKRLRKQISELNAIRRKFDEYDRTDNNR
jgi:hypothetical protein